MNTEYSTLPLAWRACVRCQVPPPDSLVEIRRVAAGFHWQCMRCGHEQKYGSGGPPMFRAVEDAPAPAKAASLHQAWGRTTPLRDTIGEHFLRTQTAASVPLDGDMRFALGDNECPWPRIVAKITEPNTERTIGLYQTLIAQNGFELAGSTRRTRVLGDRGGVVKLWPSRGESLAIAVSITNALRAASTCDAPAWATLLPKNLAQLPLVNGITKLSIATDGHGTQLRAARVCADRWRAAGRDVRILVPTLPGAEAYHAGDVV